MAKETLRLEELIKHVLSNDTEQRKSAETQIMQMQEANFEEYITALLTILLSNETLEIRFTSGIVLKNTLITNNNERNTQIKQEYKNIRLEKKMEYRRALIKNFGDDQKSIGNICSTVLGCLAKLDMDCDTWPTFYSEMYDLLSSSNHKTVINALTAVKVNCQFSAITQPEKVYAMYSYYLRPDASFDLLLHNLTCLLEIQDKISNLLQTKADELITRLTSLATLDTEVVEKALLNINKLVSNVVDRIDIRRLNAFMKSFMYNGDEELRIQSVEYFITVVEKEIENEKDYLGDMTYDILNDLFTVISKEEDEVWNIHKAGTYCINLIGTKNNLVQNKNIQAYIMEKLKSEGKDKEAGIIILGAILNFSFYGDEALDSENVYIRDFIYDNETSQFITSTVKYLVTAIKSTNQGTMKNSALWTLARICETNFQNLDPSVDLVNVIEVCEVILQMKIMESVNAAWVISNMCNSMSKLIQVDKTSNNLTFFYCPLVDILVSISDTVSYKDHALRNATYSALTEAIKVCADETRLLLDKLWQYYTKKINEAVHYSMKVSDDQFNIIEDYVSSYLYVLQAIYQKKGEVGMGEKKVEFLNILISILKIERPTILFEDVYSCISATCIDSKSFFVNKVNFYINFMLRDLMSSYKGVLISDITLIGGIVSALGPGSLEYANRFIQGLIGSLTSASVSRDVKPLIITTFGDMALSLGLSFEAYIDRCFSFIPQVISIKHSFDEDFVDDLRGSVLNMLKCFILGMENSERILSNVGSIAQVIRVICAEDKRLRNVLNCIDICCDFTITFGKREEFSWMINFVRQYANSQKYGNEAMKALADMERAEEM